jgi:p-cumate 2,3-dioxygenase alpha subunit
MTKSVTEAGLDDLVMEDPVKGRFKVLRQALTSPEIYELERDRIFSRAWLYVGHASEIGEPGDYVRRDVGGRPVILQHGHDGETRCFFNSCTHRGARVCRQDFGNAKSFQCFYHAWTFGSDGELRGLPDKEGYGEHFDTKDFALRRPPRLEEYRGFWFLSYDPEIQSLYDYLAGAREYIDLIADQGEGHGGMVIIPGSQPYACNANWKLLVENSIDGYHGVPVHQTYFEFIGNRGDVSGLVKNLQSEAARGYALGNGHAVVDYPAPFPRVVAQWHPMFGDEAKADIDAAMDELVAIHGPERAARMALTCRNLFIYPNLFLLDVAGLNVRTMWPTGPDHMTITGWGMAPADETGERLKRRIEGFNLFLGPGGLATPDDIEALEACQEGFQATSDAYSDISRGMLRDAKTTDEAQMRSFWREWHAHIRNEPHGDSSRELRVPEDVPVNRSAFAPAAGGAS